MEPNTPMNDLTPHQGILTPNEFKLIVDNSLLQQEQRLTENFRKSIDDLGNKFATKEQVIAIDKKHEAKAAVQDKAIRSLEDWNAWAIRIVLGIVFTAVVGAVIVIKV